MLKRGPRAPGQAVRRVQIAFTPGAMTVRRVGILVAMFVLVAACGSGDDSVAEESGGVEITEVVFGDHVTLTNTGDVAVAVEGMWLCNRPVYVPLSGSLEPGESVTVSSADLGGLGAGGGEVGLYATRSFADATAMIDYVAWGSGGGRLGVAISAGVWSDGDSAPNDGASIARAVDGWVSGS